MPKPRPASRGAKPYGQIWTRDGLACNVSRAADGRFYTDEHRGLSGPFRNRFHLITAFRRCFGSLVPQLVVNRAGQRDRLRGAPSPAATEDLQPLSPPSEELVAAVAESASALTLQELDVSSPEELLGTTSSEGSITAIPGTIPHNTTDSSSSSSPFSWEKFMAGAAESSSPQTLQERDVSSLDELLDTTSTEEPIIAGPQTVPHDTSGGSSSTFPSRCKKFVVGAVESSSPQTPEEHLSSLKELLDTLLEDSMAASRRTVPHDTSSSPTPASSLGSSILSRSPPNWYEVFYIRMDHGGSFYMYPDLGGPFPCIDEADIAINRYLDELRRGAGCKEQANLNIVDRMVHNCKYYLDGTPKRGPNSPSNKTYDEKRYLVQALLDQYSDDHNLFGNLELEDILMRQWIYEDHRWFYHFNFTMKKREADDNPSAGRLFFAELSHMQGEDAWEVNCCCMIEDEDNGWCYGCRNNGSPGMKHPKSTYAYTGGHLDGYLSFDCVESSSSEDEEDGDTRLRHMFEGLDDPHVWDYLFPSSRSVEVEGIAGSC